MINKMEETAIGVSINISKIPNTKETCMSELMLDSTVPLVYASQ